MLPWKYRYYVPSEIQIFVQGLPKDVTVQELESYFESVGPIKLTPLGQKKIWIYYDKNNLSKGECTISYKDNKTQMLAINHYNNAIFKGHTITVSRSLVKYYQTYA